jgi:glycosyltransferase involved in cell wall biosynthesis
VRLALVNSAWPAMWGGGEKWTVEAARWLTERGHAVLVVGRPGSRLIAAARERQLSVVETAFGGDFDPLAAWRARKILAAHRAELAVVNFNKEAWQFGLAARSLGLPVVARHGFPLLHRGLHHRALLSLVLSRVVVNAASIRERYRKQGLPVAEMEVIHNGVLPVTPREGELRRRCGVAEDELLLLAAGRLESQKRFERLLDIARLLLPLQPRLRVLIAGEGPLKASLEAEAAARGLDRHVQCIGFLPDFAAVAGDADLFLLTSDDEGTPNALLEAMAAGVACVAFAVGAVPEILTGALAADAIAPGDTTAMAARAALLLGDPARRVLEAAAMQEHVARDFSFEQSMRRFETLFRQRIKP